MNTDRTAETASVEVHRDQFVEGLRRLAKLVKPRKAAKALVWRDGEDLVVEIGGGEIRAEINGRWEGRARLNGLLLIRAAKGQSPIKPLMIRVESGRLIISGSSIPCDWESTTAAHVLIPIGATLFDTLLAGEQHSDEDLERAGQIDVVRDARKKRKRLIRHAVRVLQPLKVTEANIDAVVDRQLASELTRLP